MAGLNDLSKLPECIPIACESKGAPAKEASTRTQQVMFLYKYDCYNHTAQWLFKIRSRAALGQSQPQLICLKAKCMSGMWRYAKLPVAKFGAGQQFFEGPIS